MISRQGESFSVASYFRILSREPATNREFPKIWFGSPLPLPRRLRLAGVVGKIEQSPDIRKKVTSKEPTSTTT